MIEAIAIAPVETIDELRRSVEVAFNRLIARINVENSNLRSPLDGNGHPIQNLAPPVRQNDAVTLDYMNNEFSKRLRNIKSSGSRGGGAPGAAGPAGPAFVENYHVAVVSTSGDCNIDLADGVNHEVNLSQPVVAIKNPTFTSGTIGGGQPLTIYIVQDATTPDRTVTWDTDYVIPVGAELVGAVNTYSVFEFRVRNDGKFAIKYYSTGLSRT